MARWLFILSSFFLPFLVVSYAAPEEYWRSVLPSTHMPKAIRDVINIGDMDEKLLAGTILLNRYSGEIGETTSIFSNYMGHLMLGDKNSFDPRLTLFFPEQDLKPGAQMTLAFPRSSYKVAFLYHRHAESIPFSSSKLPEILSRFSIDPESALAKSMMQTLKKCELPNVDGEQQLCATSLKSMVDFSSSSLGTHQVEGVSTAVMGEDEEVKDPQLFSIAPNGVRRLPGDMVVSCHEEGYPYAVFFCRASFARGYVVELAAEGGMRVEAVATCHTNTEAWNPKHLAFRLLKVRPGVGVVTVCHFLPLNHLLWTRSD